MASGASPQVNERLTLLLQNDPMPRDVAHPGQQVLESRRVARLLAGMPQDLPEPFDARMLLAVQQAVGPSACHRALAAQPGPR